MPPSCNDALDRRLDPASSRPVAVAFSGGSDSLALLVLAKTWSRRAGRPVVALTVDHGLHPDSGRWTLAAERMAHRLGVAWRGLAWVGDKPSTGLPAAARRVRHRLLAQAAHEIGARVILVGHTADDWRESELIRQATPGLGRMREWAPSPAWPQGRGLFLLRPLLGARRADLRAELEGMGLGWLEDPGNGDLRFARSRARLALRTEVEIAPPAPDRDEDALKGWAADVTETSDGRLSISRARFAAAAPHLRQFTGAALLCAGGGDRPARGESLGQLVERLCGRDVFTATLAGCRVVADENRINFARELGEAFRRGGLADTLLPYNAPEDGPVVVFDGRFEVRAQAPGLRLAPIAGRMGRLGRADARTLRALPAYARGALPALVDGEGAVSLPAPFGTGPASVRALVAERLAARCGAIRCEAELEG